MRNPEVMTMLENLSAFQIILAFIFLLFAGGSAFYGARSRKTVPIYSALVFLGFILMTLFPGWLLALCILMIVVGACILFHGQSKQIFKKKVTGWILLFAGLIAFAVIRYVMAPDDNETLRLKLKQYSLAEYEKLGSFAQERYAGLNVIAVVPENMTDRQKDCLKAFEQGYGGTVDTVEQKMIDFVAFREENAHLESAEYNALLQKTINDHSLENLFRSGEMIGVDVVLLLTSLPGKRIECLSTLNSLRDSRKILLLPMDCAGRVNVLSTYIRDGLIGALVMMNADSSIKNDVPENLEEAFNSRFVLVTAENIDAMLEDPKYRVVLFDDEAEPREEE